MKRTTVVTARIPNEKARRLYLLALLRGVKRQAIIETGIDVVLAMAPEVREINRLIATGETPVTESQP